MVKLLISLLFVSHKPHYFIDHLLEMPYSAICGSALLLNLAYFDGSQIGPNSDAGLQSYLFVPFRALT